MKFTTLVSLLVSTLLPIFNGSPTFTYGIEFSCDGKQVLSTSYIGQDQNVKSEVIHCPYANVLHTREELMNRQDPTNVCGATCNTNCFAPSGGGPNPNDCQVISDALLYDSQNVGALFTIPANTSGILMQYQTCESFIIDQASYNLTYCRTDWSSVLEYVAFNCQSTQNAHGGNCVASDQRWFIQVQAVP